MKKLTFIHNTINIHVFSIELQDKYQSIKGSDIELTTQVVLGLSISLSSLNHLAVGLGTPVQGMAIRMSCPAWTVMSLTPDRSRVGLHGWSSILILSVGLLASPGPRLLMARTLNWYSSPSRRFGMVAWVWNSGTYRFKLMALNQHQMSSVFCFKTKPFMTVYTFAILTLLQLYKICIFPTSVCQYILTLYYKESQKDLGTHH